MPDILGKPVYFKCIKNKDEISCKCITVKGHKMCPALYFGDEGIKDVFLIKPKSCPKEKR